MVYTAIVTSYSSVVMVGPRKDVIHILDVYARDNHNLCVTFVASSSTITTALTHVRLGKTSIKLCQLRMQMLIKLRICMCIRPLPMCTGQPWSN